MFKEYMVMDIECYPNYFLVQFMNQDGRFRYFELHEGASLDVKKIRGLMANYPTITFNGNNYDIPILTLALSGADNETLKNASDKLVVGGVKPWMFYRQYGLSELTYNHIDIYEPTPGVLVSLKLYGGRIHMHRLQDLPYDPNELLTKEQFDHVRLYCENDILTTHCLFKQIEERIELRRSMGIEYRTDLRSKSDAQVAEAVIKSELYRLTGKKLSKQSVREKQFFYKAPDYIKFETPQLKKVLEIVLRSPFTAKTNGQIEMTKELADLVVEMGVSRYQLGIGGLHSQESSKFHVTDDDYIIVDRDVASYYPNIILNNNLYPEALGTEFLDVYRTIVERRLKAKHEGDKVVNESLKITINGTFGKLGSVYSAIYAPDLMIQVTVTGQLTLLMLIEWLETNGISVVSANTDGIVIKCPRNLEREMNTIVANFEKLTNFETEESKYLGIYSRDVNNYIAIGENGKVKTKGTFSPGGLQKNPANDICNEAVIAYLKDSTPWEDTIQNCKDITKFVTVRTVKGGGVQGDDYLGKCVRWYYGTTSKGALHYRGSGNKVPRSDGAVALMELPHGLPMDIDYAWYINECRELLMDVGVMERPPVVKKTRAKKEKAA